jgi:uncharacterized RDD family membrane protein YckC
MRCPKCQYITFDSGDRCRNCGYEFSFAVDDPQVDVAIRREEPPPGRLRDVSLTALDAPLAASGHSTGAEREAESYSAGPQALSVPDLPLFTDRIADDQAPLVTPPAVPRPPLSVRRANPTAHARRSIPEELPLELAAETDKQHWPEAAAADTASDQSGDAASPGRRIGAGLIDLGVLGAIQAAVVYLTLRLCELTPAEWHLLPWPPLAAFLLLLCGGYFILFTAAGGQTIGKMATRIRVVAHRASEIGDPRVSFGAAFIRTVAALGSVVALGAGFVPVLLGGDRRAFHDRVAETRVVNA